MACFKGTPAKLRDGVRSRMRMLLRALARLAREIWEVLLLVLGRIWPGLLAGLLLKCQ